MKKVSIAWLMLVLSFSLTSCKVNWFDQQYDVQWWVIAIPVIIFFAIAWIAAGRRWTLLRLPIR